MINFKKWSVYSLLIVFVLGFFYYQNAKIKHLKGEILTLQNKNDDLQSALNFKIEQVNLLDFHCKESQNLSVEILDAKTKILNTQTKTHSQNGVDESLKKAGEFIIKGVQQ